MAGTTPPPVPIPDQNLISTKTVSFGRPPGYWKSIMLDFLSVFAALAFGYVYFRYLTVGISPWYVIGTFFVFSALSVLQVFLARNIVRRTFIVLAEAIALVAPFVFYDDWQIVALTGAVAFVVLIWGYFISHSEAHNSLELQFFRISRNVLGKVVTAAIVFMILVYAPQVDGRGTFFPQANFKTFFDWAAGSLSGFYPGISFTGSFGQFAGDVAKSELQKNPTFSTLSPQAQDAAIAQASTQLAQGVANTTGIVPAPSDLMSTVVYNYIVAALSGWRNRFQSQFIFIWAIVLFLALRTIGVVFVWAAQLVSLVVYEILLAAGFMHIEKAAQTQEIVQY